MPASKLLMDIGDRLRERREEMKLTQKEAGKLLGISETFYGEIERGNKRLSIERMLEVEKKMDMDLTYLLTGEKITSRFMIDVYNKCPEDKRDLMEELLIEIAKLYQ